MNQKNGVYTVIFSLFPQLVQEAQRAKQPLELNKDELKLVHSTLVRKWDELGIDYKGGTPSVEKLNKYVPGLVNNWMRKDERLNGDTKYEAKAPGSRTGSGDASLQAMRNLLAITTDPAVKALIQTDIDNRKKELEQAKLKPINLDHLPAHLREYAEQLQAARNS